MDSHVMDNLDELRTHLRELAPQLGYLVIGREKPKWQQLDRLEWSVEAAALAGLADAPDEEDLPQLALTWVEQRILEHAQPGHREVFRVRLFPPKGGAAIKQLVLAADPLDDPPEPMAATDSMVDAPNAGMDALVGRILELHETGTRVLFAEYRKLLAEKSAHTRQMALDLADARANNRALFEHHVQREIGVANKAKAEAEAAIRAASAASSDDFISATTSTLGKLAMAAVNLPPDMADFISEHPELVEAMRDPKVREILADPEAKSQLVAFLRGAA